MTATDLLVRALGPGARLTRSPSASASTAALEDLDVVLADGARRLLLLKSGGRDPAREVAVYRGVLAGAGLGTPGLVAADPAAGWLVLERLDAVPLWQSGDLRDWCRAAAWLARAHRVLAPAAARTPAAAGTDWDAQLRRALARDARVRELAAPYAEAVGALAAAPPTVVHGEAFASNLLLHPDGRVCAVDWETAGSGPALLDLAALTAGWGAAEAGELAAAYGGDLGLLPAARLVTAVRWLGEPVPHAAAGGGHARRTDWWAEACRACGAPA